MLREVREDKFSVSSGRTIRRSNRSVNSTGATVGVPTAAELASQFDEIMVEIRKAEFLPDNGNVSMLDSALATLADRAKIKPTGLTAGDTPLAVLARAHYHIHRGELARRPELWD